MSEQNEKRSVVDSLFDVGEAWASHGLRIAESALIASAQTLTSVSTLLGSLSEELKKERRAQSDVIDAPQN